jgi:uncharacterized protein YcfJ
MSQLSVDSITGRVSGSAPSLPNGAVVTGVVTATTFSGNVTGNLTGNVTGNVTGNLTGNVTGTASTATLATNAQGLTGSPNISVSGINNTGVSTQTDTRLSSIADKTTLVSGNTVSLVYNTGGGNVAICTNPTGPITLNVTGIPTDSSFDNRAISFAVIVQQNTTAYGCSDVSLNGVVFNSRAAAGVQTAIAYVSGTVATASTTGYDVFNFTGINTVGSAASTLNYKLLSNVSGGYRRY